MGCEPQWGGDHLPRRVTARGHLTRHGQISGGRRCLRRLCLSIKSSFRNREREGQSAPRASRGRRGRTTRWRRGGPAGRYPCQKCKNCTRNAEFACIRAGLAAGATARAGNETNKLASFTNSSRVLALTVLGIADRQKPLPDLTVAAQPGPPAGPDGTERDRPRGRSQSGKTAGQRSLREMPSLRIMAFSVVRCSPRRVAAVVTTPSLSRSTRTI
jgi:hypothetical protein